MFIALCTLALIPALYQTIKTFLISANGTDHDFDIIGQMEWFDLINETLQAFLIIPLYPILNKIYKNDRENFAEYAFKTGLLTFILYALFSAGVLIHGITLIKEMNPDDTDIVAINTYLQLETVAFMLGINLSFINVIFVVIGKDKNVYIFLAINTTLSIISDFVLIPNSGIYGIAVSNITVNALLAISGYLLLYLQKHIRFCRFRKSDLSVLKKWCKIGFYSGSQQFLDNFIYAVMVCKMVNAVKEQGNYWLANNFIWGWLLIPITALSEVIKCDCKDGYKNLKQSNYYLIGCCVVALWLITVPLWIPFFRYVQNLSNATEIFNIVLKLTPFYIIYIGCTITDNIFIGLGKTYYNAITSIIVNFVYYGVFYFLYITKSVSFNLNTIIEMFGFGIVAHLLVSLTEEKIFLRRKEIKTLPVGRDKNFSV